MFLLHHFQCAKCENETIRESCAMDKTAFYGKKSLRGLSWKVRLAKKEREHSRAPMPCSYLPRLSSPSGHWQVFHRQTDAFQFAASRSKDLHVFAFESECFVEKRGQRLFLVASYEHFWHYYRQMNRGQRHHYEVIPEGSVCHLYFDLEFQKLLNPDTDGPKAVKILIKYVCFKLAEIFHVQCSSENVLVMDASTEQKFSQHLIFRIKQAAFKCNIDAGNFVRHIFSQFLEVVNSKVSSEAQPSPVKVTTTPEKPRDGTSNGHDVTGCTPTLSRLCVVCDTPTDSHLLIDEVDGHSPDTNEAHLCVVDAGVSVDNFLEQTGLSLTDLSSLVVKDKNGKNALLVDLGVYTKNRNFRLYLSCKLGRDNPLQVTEDCLYQPSPRPQTSTQQLMFLDSLVANVTYTSELRILSFGARDPSTEPSLAQNSPNSKRSEFTGGYEQSPFPDVDRFVSALVQKPRPGALPGSIRRWVYFSHGGSIIYDIARNRWCGNIGRAHKSNQIMIVVDLNRKVYYQKCFDPDCKAIGYKSPDQPLPSYLHSAISGEDNSCPSDVGTWGDSDDDDLILAASRLEARLEFSDEDDEVEEEMLKATAAAEQLL